MAKKPGKIYLGYEEETITEKNLTLLNFTVNKIGGLPNWPPIENIQFPSKCPLCGLHRLLVVQCYAPLEISLYHRTLYVFACINPNCWNQSESWLCVRSQFLDQSKTEVSSIVSIPSPDTNLTWCNGADEWDENDNGDSANGNIMGDDNAPSQNNAMQRNSDDDESNSYELESVEQALGNLQVFDAHNANMSPVQGAVGAIGVPVAAAELEGGDEPGLVTVDTPTNPPKDIEQLLNQTAELPQDMRSRLMGAPLQFLPKFIYVEEEWKKSGSSDEKIAELISKYKKENDIEPCVDRLGAGGEDDVYEEAAPLHGDRLFHAFITRLRNNPGQILRYSRDEPPLLGSAISTSACAPDAPLVPTACPRCGSRLICELQLVPEFAEALRVLPHNIPLSHLHFLSVLVFTCAQSCWQPSDSVVKETVVFQPEVLFSALTEAVPEVQTVHRKMAPAMDYLFLWLALFPRQRTKNKSITQVPSYGERAVWKRYGNGVFIVVGVIITALKAPMVVKSRVAAAPPQRLEYATAAAARVSKPERQQVPAGPSRDKEGFIKVERRKRESTSRNLCGTAVSTELNQPCLLRAEVPTTPLYVSWVHYAVKPEAVVEYLKQKTGLTMRVEQL